MAVLCGDLEMVVAVGSGDVLVSDVVVNGVGFISSALVGGTVVRYALLDDKSDVVLGRVKVIFTLLSGCDNVFIVSFVSDVGLVCASH